MLIVTTAVRYSNKLKNNVKGISSKITVKINKYIEFLSLHTVLSDSPVYTPSSDPIEWAIAKTQMELAENFFCQGYHHLGGMHYVYTVFCLVYKRHFSTQHPLYDMLKYHCEGTTPHIILSYDLAGLESALNSTMVVGTGQNTQKLAEKSFHERQYGNYDYDNLIKVFHHKSFTVKLRRV